MKGKEWHNEGKSMIEWIKKVWYGEGKKYDIMKEKSMIRWVWYNEEKSKIKCRKW